MKALVWNCRGVNSENSTTIPHIRWLVRRTNPDFVFLSETKCLGSDIRASSSIKEGGVNELTLSQHEVQWVISYGFHDFGALGQVLCCSPKFTQAAVEEARSSFMLEPEARPGRRAMGLFRSLCREEVWANLTQNFKTFQGPIAIIGDYNQVEFIDQKSGGSCHLPRAKKFREWRIENGLTELPSHGPAFTWCNNREGERKRPYKLEAWCLEDPQIKEIIGQHLSRKIRGSPMYISMRRQEARGKKRLGITWDLFKEELGPLQANLKNRQEGGSEISKRLECQEKAKLQLLYWKQKGKSYVEHPWGPVYKFLLSKR
ncbi:putative RNA-directed DNA polymerase from transposon X-element [Bienertia sinuspersici]